MKKQMIATCVLLLFVMMSVHTYAKEGEGKQRAVMLVYDDSGSMRNSGNGPVDRWKYANYALQSLVGLLDGNDYFSYVPMSNPFTEVPVSLQKRQEEMNTIRGLDTFKNTPFQSVITAIESVKRQAMSNANAEYWFMIVTDGAFNELQVSNRVQYDNNKKMMVDTLQSFTNWMNERNISVHCLLITMESNISDEERQQMNTFKGIWKQTTNGILLPTDGEDGIIHSINEAAALITNRDPFSNTEDIIKLNVKNDIVSFSSPFPMRRITVVQQGGGSQLGITSVSDKEAKLDGPYVMSAPNLPMVNGSIMHISHHDGSIMKPGMYTLQLDKAISSSQSMKVLVEPALDFSVDMYQKNGSDLQKSTGTVYRETPIVIEAKPTNLPVNPSLFSASFEQDGQIRNMTWNEERKAFQLETVVHSDTLRGIVKMNIKGFYQQTKEVIISTTLKPTFTIQVENTAWKENVVDLTHSPPIIIQPLINGKPMDEKDVALLQKSLTLNKHVNFEWKQNGTKLYVYPRPYFSPVLDLTETGTIQATLQLEHERYGKANQTFTFVIENAPFWQRYEFLFQKILPFIVLILLLFILVIGWISRARFHRRAFIVYEFDQSLADEWIHKGEPELLQSSWWKHYIGIPFRSERRTVQSVTFIAKKGTKAIFIAKESQIEGMIIDGAKLEREEVGIAHRTLYPNEKIIIDRKYGKETYKYECE